MRIGVFDSGVGGVNVLSCLIEKYPNNEYIFFGDTKNLPYGDKTKEELMNLASQAIDFLISKNVDIIVIACGTISSNCYKELKKKYHIPLYDIISPTIRFIEKCDYSNIGVIATSRTIESNIFKVSNKKMILKKTPTFVPIIENNEVEEKANEITNELQEFRKCDILILGCTHYPLLKNVIDNSLHIKTIDMGKCLTEELNISNNSKYSCELYFSSISVNLVNNIEKILHSDYQIFAK